MSAQREPPKWLTANDEIAAQLRPALRIAQADGPSAAEHERMWGSLAAALPAAVASGAEPSPAAGRDAGAQLVLAARPGLWRIVGTGFVAAALGFGAAKLTSAPSVPAGPAPAHQAQAHAEAAPAVPMTAAPQRPAAIEERPPLAPGSPARAARAMRRIEAAPRPRGASLPESRSRPSVLAAPRPQSGHSGAAGDLSAELDLLARARRVVAGSPARALQLTAEHAQRFSDGVLTQEREVLAIEALSRLGRQELAAKRTRRFLERYPDSAHRVRLDAQLRTHE